MQITGQVTLTFELSDRELAHALRKRAMQLLKIDDDAGSDFLTDGMRVFLGSTDLGLHPIAASLIDASNHLLYGKCLVGR